MTIQKTNEIFYNGGGNDECYTPIKPVEVIQKYIPKDKTIWCPFDKDFSNFVKILSQTNNVIYSHIDNGQDFLTWQPEQHWDIIVSNPPFTDKKIFFERALSFNKPFALIMTNTWLNDSAPKKLFKDKDLQLLMFDKRMRFIKPNGEQMGSPTFSSSFYCYDLLPKQIIMEEL